MVSKVKGEGDMEGRRERVRVMKEWIGEEEHRQNWREGEREG